MMKSKKFVLLILVFAQISLLMAQKPVSHPDADWTLLDDYSDEFNDGSVDLNKWDIDVNDWGVWSWEPKHVVEDQSGVLKVSMDYNVHERDGQTLYFTSGCARQKKTITYGYFEARIKGCDRFPGVCPAFWMYSIGEPITNGVKYNEIDFMEIQQRQFDVTKIDMNLHVVREINGELVREDPKNLYVAPWDPRDDFHVYGCNVTEDLVTFYIDGVEVASYPNDYWFLPQYVTLSMGVRPPLMDYENGEKVPVELTESPEAFPTEMLVDYVRVWENDATSSSEDPVSGDNLYPESPIYYGSFENNNVMWYSGDSHGLSVGWTDEAALNGRLSAKFHVDDCETTSQNTGNVTAVLGGGDGTESAGNVLNIAAGTYTFKAKVHIEGGSPSQLIVFFSESSSGISGTGSTALYIPLDNVSIGGDPLQALGWQTISATVELPAYSAMKTGLRTRSQDYSGITGASTMYLDNLELIGEVSTDIDSDTSVEFNVFPNPASERITVTTKSKGDLVVYDLRGGEVKNYKNISEEIAIPVSDLGNGIYFIRFTSQGNSSVKKILIQ